MGKKQKRKKPKKEPKLCPKCLQTVSPGISHKKNCKISENIEVYVNKLTGVGKERIAADILKSKLHESEEAKYGACPRFVVNRFNELSHLNLQTNSTR